MGQVHGVLCLSVEWGSMNFLSVQVFCDRWWNAQAVWKRWGKIREISDTLLENRPCANVCLLWLLVCCVWFLKASKQALFGVFFSSSLVPILVCTFHTRGHLNRWFFKPLLAYSLYTLTLDCRVFCWKGLKNSRDLNSAVFSLTVRFYIPSQK